MAYGNEIFYPNIVPKCEPYSNLCQIPNAIPRCSLTVVAKIDPWSVLVDQWKGLPTPECSSKPLSPDFALLFICSTFACSIMPCAGGGAAYALSNKLCAGQKPRWEK